MGLFDSLVIFTKASEFSFLTEGVKEKETAINLLTQSKPRKLKEKNRKTQEEVPPVPASPPSHDDDIKRTRVIPKEPLIDKESGLPFDGITPKILFDFFNENPKCKDPATGKFKFGFLTLYACTSLTFAAELSSLMAEVVIMAQNINNMNN
jgi:hypothetical protein